MHHPLLRPLGFGEVLDRAFSLYRRDFTPFVAATLGPLALAVVGGFATGISTADPAGFEPGAVLAFLAVVTVVALLMWASLTHLASQAYGGLPVRAAEGVRVGLRRLLPSLVAVLLATVALFAVLMAITMGFAVAVAILIPSANLGEGGLTGAVAAGLIATVALVGMLVLYTVAAAYFFAVLPAVVIEGKGPVASLRRSIELARGAVPRLVGLIVVCVTITQLPPVGIAVLTGTFASAYDPAAMEAARGSPAFLLQQVLSWLAWALTTPFFVTALVVQYYDRRVRTEGLDVRAAAERLAGG
jgi:hypothetical protein